MRTVYMTRENITEALDCMHRLSVDKIVVGMALDIDYSSVDRLNIELANYRLKIVYRDGYMYLCRQYIPDSEVKSLPSFV